MEKNKWILSYARVKWPSSFVTFSHVRWVQATEILTGRPFTFTSTTIIPRWGRVKNKRHIYNLEHCKISLFDFPAKLRYLSYWELIRPNFHGISIIFFIRVANAMFRYHGNQVCNFWKNWLEGLVWSIFPTVKFILLSNASQFTHFVPGFSTAYGHWNPLNNKK